MGISAATLGAAKKYVDTKISGAAGSSGTSNYNDLTNKPSINGVSLTQDMTADDLHITNEQIQGMENYVKDESYTHTDNNFTNEQVEQLSDLYYGACTCVSWRTLYERMRTEVEMAGASISSLPFCSFRLAFTESSINIFTTTNIEETNIDIRALGGLFNNTAWGWAILSLLNNAIGTIEYGGAVSPIMLKTSTRNTLSIVDFTQSLMDSTYFEDDPFCVDLSQIGSPFTICVNVNENMPVVLMNTVTL